MTKIGADIRALRKRRHLSTRELAARSGLSHSTISLVERDRISPSLDTLQAILDALGSRLSEFLAGLEEAGIGPFHRAEDLPEIGNPESISYRIVGLGHPRRAIQFLHETYQPGADTGEMFSHVAQEAGYVVRGRIEVTVGGAVSVLGPGDAYYFDSSTKHRFRNVGAGVAEIVSAITPPSY